MSWETFRRPLAQRRRGPQAEAVLGFMREHGGCWTPKTLAVALSEAGLDAGGSPLRLVLANLVRAGSVRRTRRGVYTAKDAQ